MLSRDNLHGVKNFIDAADNIPNQLTCTAEAKS